MEITYISGNHKGGRTFDDVGVGSWNSPEEFLNSEYNTRDDDSKQNIDKNNFGFEEGYLIETTPEQDKIMVESFTMVSESDYRLLGNNCALAVQRSLFDAGIPVADSKYKTIRVPANKHLGEDSFVVRHPNFNPIPSEAYKSIIKHNPKGKRIHK